MGARVSAEIKRALKLVAKGMSAAEAARKCGVNPSSVSKALKREKK